MHNASPGQVLTSPNPNIRVLSSGFRVEGLRFRVKGILKMLRTFGNPARNLFGSPMDPL